VVALAAAIPYYTLEDVLPQIYEQGKTPLFLLLDGITDVRNFGAIARAARCLGVDAIILPQKNAAPVNADAVKASAGALAQMTVCREKALPAAIGYLKLNGIHVIVAEGRADKPIDRINWSVPCALVLG